MTAVRLVTDPASTLAAAFWCLHPVGNDHCMRQPGHRGGHIPMRHPWPHTDISSSNPKYVRSVA